MKPFANNIVVFFCTILTFAAQAAPLGKQLSHALGKLDDEIVGSAITTHSVDKSAIADWLPITFEYELKGQEVVTVCVPRGVSREDQGVAGLLQAVSRRVSRSTTVL